MLREAADHFDAVWGEGNKASEAMRADSAALGAVAAKVRRG